VHSLAIVRHPLLRVALVVALLAAYPHAFPGALNFGFSLVLFAALATAWDLVGGWAGQLSLGHAAFVGFGAYASVLLWLRWQIPLWWGVPAAVAAGALLAAGWGWLTFRLRGAYFSLSSIAVAEVLRVVANNWVGLTGGPEGISVNELPSPFGLDLFDRRVQFHAALGLLAVALLAAWRISASRFGARLEAIREDEDSSMALGVNPTRMKMLAFVASAALTVVGGAIYAVHLSFFEPQGLFDLHFSVQLVLMAIVGGMGTVLGPTLGALLLLGFQELFRSTFQQGSLFIYGIMIVVIVRFAPEGLSGFAQSAWRRFRRARRAADRLTQG
jgi:branched-chain amino acid transport system permease protein